MCLQSSACRQLRRDGLTTRRFRRFRQYRAAYLRLRRLYLRPLLESDPTRGQRRGCGELDDRAARGTLRHQILENFGVAVGSGGVPGNVRFTSGGFGGDNQPRPALTSVCT